MIQIELRLFGVYRKYVKNSNILQFELDENHSAITPQAVKAWLAAYLSDFPASRSDIELIADSAIANERKILTPEEPILNSCSLAILPPVCGG